MLHGDEADAIGRALGVPVAARELEARLVGLGAAVAEEDAGETRERRQPSSRFGLERMKVQVRRVQQRVRLIGDHRSQTRMRVAQRCDADPRHEVQVLTAIDVIETRPLAAHERHRLTPVGLQHVL